MSRIGNSRRAVIICSGRFHNPSTAISPEDLVICADGGADHAYELGIRPDILLGDFDSVSPEVLEHWQKSGVEVKSYPVRKDQTDSEIALDLAALEHDVGEIILIGALGGRWDHSLANILLLDKISREGRKGRIDAGSTSLFLLSDSFPEVRISGSPGDIVSLVPLSEKVTGVTLTGLEYPLANAELHLSETRGVSNVLLSEEAVVAISTGRLVVIHTVVGSERGE